MQKQVKQPLRNRLVRWGNMILMSLMLAYCVRTLQDFVGGGMAVSVGLMLILMGVLIGFEHLLAVIHETGHFIGGWLSGRKLYYISIAGWHLLRTPEGRFRFGYEATPGISGSCATVAEGERQSFSAMLLSGPLATMLLGGICGLLAWCTLPSAGVTWEEDFRLALCHVPLTMLAVQGISNGVNNLIPRWLVGGYSDGMQLQLLLRKGEDWAEWLRLQRFAWEHYQGHSLLEMPPELFAPVPECRRDSPYGASLMMYRLARLMDERDFAAALALSQEMLEDSHDLVPLHLLGAVRTGAVCEMLLDAPGEMCQRMRSPVIRRLMKTTGKTPGTLLTKYILARLEGNPARTEMAEYKRMAARSPFIRSAEMDAGLLKIVEQKAKEAEGWL